MLSLNQIKQFYPKVEAISERNMLREYLQYKILHIIYSSKYARNIVFHGGTAIRIIYENDRFSEDLDFDFNNISKDKFTKLMKLIKRELEKENLMIETRSVFKDAYRCYLKIPELLYNYKLSGHKTEKILIQIDIKAPKYTANPDLKIINKFGVFDEIKVYPKDILLAGKIGAVLTRNRVLGRDLYDIVYLASLTKPNADYLQQRFKYASEKEVKKAIEKKIKSYSLPQLAQDIAPFIADRNKLAVVRKFDKWLKGWRY